MGGIQQSDNEDAAEKGRYTARKPDKKVTFRVSDYLENENEEDGAYA